MPKIINEEGELERLLKKKNLQGTQQELNLLAKWFRSQGKGERGILKSLLEYADNNFQQFNPVVNREKLRNAVRVGMKYPIKRLSNVYVTKAEIEEIQQVMDFRIQQILFSFLVFVKASNPEDETGVFVTGTDKSTLRYILKMSSSNYSLSDFENLTHWLFSVGYFDGRMIYRTLSYVYFPQYIGEWNPEEYEIEIEGKARVLETAGEIYKNYCGGVLYWCDNCGKMGVRATRNSRNVRCENCAPLIDKLKKDSYNRRR